MTVVILHNPACGTSRNLLALIEATGEVPVVIDYLTTGWTRPQLGLLDADVSDDALLDAMLAHPVLVNRPIVCSPKGVRLCRPSDAVLDLLDRLPPGPMTKEDGTPLIDAAGRCVG